MSAQELDKAFFISQIGERGSPERKRSDEVFDHIVTPVGKEHGLSVIRGDRDPTPGQITAQLIRSLLDSKVIFADLTGRNPNVYYELGVAHSFRLPVIILVDQTSSLSFDTQNERVIVVGDNGIIGVSQAEDAKSQLRSVLGIVLQEGYEPENLLTAVATTQSLDALAPTNPIASELTGLRDLMERTNSIVAKALQDATEGLPNPEDYKVLREFVEGLVQQKRVTQRQLKEGLFSFTTTGEFDQWVEGLKEKVKPARGGQFNDEPPF